MRGLSMHYALAVGALLLVAARNNPSGDIQSSGGGGGNSSITSPLDLGANGQLSFGPDATGAANANQRICIGTVNPTSDTGAGGYNGIAIGSGALINVGTDPSADRNICIGAACSVTVDAGNHAFRSVAIGPTATIVGYRDISLGNGAACYGQVNTAIGNFATVGGALAAQQVTQSIAIGNSATNPNNFSVALGAGATVTTDHQVMLGTAAETVVHPGPTTLTGALTANANVTVNAATALNGNTTIAGTEAVTGAVNAAAVGITGKSQIQSSADGYLGLYNNAATGFTGLRFGGVTASSPMIKSTGTALAARLADDSADAPLSASNITASGTLGVTGASTLAAVSGTTANFSSTVTAGAGSGFVFNGRSQIQSSADGYVGLYNNAATGFTGLRFGGVTSSSPMLKSTGTTLAARLADDSADAPITASNITVTTATIGSGYATMLGGVKTYSTVFINYANTTAGYLAFGNESTSPTAVRVSAGRYQIQDFGTGTHPGYIMQGFLPVSKTANYTLTFSDLDIHFNTSGAAGAVQFTLPAPQANFIAHFAATAAQTMTVVTPSGSIFAPGGLTGATRTVTAGTAANQYTSFSVECHDGTNYIVTRLTGPIS